jgi:chromosome segregation ATPase
LEKTSSQLKTLRSEKEADNQNYMKQITEAIGLHETEKKSLEAQIADLKTEAEKAKEKSDVLLLSQSELEATKAELESCKKQVLEKNALHEAEKEKLREQTEKQTAVAEQERKKSDRLQSELAELTSELESYKKKASHKPSLPGTENPPKDDVRPDEMQANGQAKQSVAKQSVTTGGNKKF